MNIIELKGMNEDPDVRVQLCPVVERAFMGALGGPLLLGGLVGGLYKH